MAINQLKKANTIDSLANAYSKNDGSLKAAALFTVAIDGTIERDQAGIFLLNPTTITEGKASNWAAQSVPGQSDPVLQWTSGSARTLNFQALVTADTSNYVMGQTTKPGQANNNSLDRVDTVMGGIAAKFFKVAAPQIRAGSEDKTELDVSTILNYYRSLLYPIYDKKENPRRLTGSPPLCVLYMGKSVTKLPYGQKVTSQHDLWVVTNIEIQVTKFLPNLAPLEAVVTFQLTQYNIRSFDRKRFLSRDE